MSYLEELLPEFRKGSKIRCDYWDKGQFIQLKEDGYIYDDRDDRIELSSLTIFGKSWELYKEPEPNWEYIINNKCLCYFYDDEEEENKHIGILKELKKYETYKFSIVTPDNYVSDISFVNCRPVRRDEVTFYEDKKDE